MSYYEPVDRRVWADAKFMVLSGGVANAKQLWIYLLTGPHCSQRTPGLFKLHPAVVADDHGWETSDTRRCLAELVDAGMIRWDQERRVVLIPNKLRHVALKNQDQLAGWMRSLEEIPECELRDEWVAIMTEVLTEQGRVAWLDSPTSGAPKPRKTARRQATNTDATPPEHNQNTTTNTAATPSEHNPDTTHDTETEIGQPSGIRNQEKEKEQEEEGPVARQSARPPDLALVGDPEPDASVDARSRLARERLHAWEAWKAQLARDRDCGSDAAFYVAQLERVLEEFYAFRGGEFSPKRKATIAARLRSLDVATQLFAIEKYLDVHRTKDERYLTGIARNLARLSDAEFAAEMAAHRRSVKDGMFSLVQEVAAS